MTRFELYVSDKGQLQRMFFAERIFVEIEPPDYGYGGECFVARHKPEVAKNFDLVIEDDILCWARNAQHTCAEIPLNGIDIMRTSVATDRMDGPECVRSDKALANVEHAFRSLKTVDLKVRPIHSRPFAAAVGGTPQDPRGLPSLRQTKVCAALRSLKKTWRYPRGNG